MLAPLIVGFLLGQAPTESTPPAKPGEPTTKPGELSPTPTEPKPAPSDKLELSALDGRLTFRPDLHGLFRYRGDIPGDGTKSGSTFNWRRLRPGISGQAFFSFVQYRLQLEAAGTSVSLLDGFVDLSLPLHTKLRLGQFKVPYSRQFITSSAELQMFDTSLVVDTFARPGRDLGGAFTMGLVPARLDLSLGVFNGSGINVPNDNSQQMFAGRLQGILFGKVPFSEGDPERSEPGLAVAINGIYNPRNPSKTVVGPSGLPEQQVQPQIRDAQAGFDVAFRGKGIYATAEGHWKRSRSQSGLVQHALGGFLQAGFLPWRTLELAGRAGVVDPDTRASDDHTQELQAELNYYFLRHSLKLQTAFAVARQHLGPDRVDVRRQIFVQAQLAY